MDLRTAVIVHGDCVDTDAKFRDLIHTLVLRLERRVGVVGIPWVAFGPVLIRRAKLFRESSGMYFVGVRTGSLA